jgi:predicted transcriptional regulator
MPETARDVLSYFLRNPEAADSLEGVARWRLLEEALHRSLAQVERAVRWLVDQGFLVRDERAGAGALYRLNLARRDDARRLLGRRTGAAAPGAGSDQS